MDNRDPNDYQVGGNHYKTDYEHWDLVLNCNLGYLDGCASKYISRWRKKGQPEDDLSKAQHYIAKLMDSASVAYPPDRMPLQFIYHELDRYAHANMLSHDDRTVIQLICTWTTKRELEMAHNWVTNLLRQFQAKSVPLEDSNKHAERAICEEENNCEQEEGA